MDLRKYIEMERAKLEVLESAAARADREYEELRDEYLILFDALNNYAEFFEEQFEATRAIKDIFLMNNQGDLSRYEGVVSFPWDRKAYIEWDKANPNP